MEKNRHGTTFDIRLTFYRVVKQLLLLFILVVCLKAFFCDINHITTDQIAPTLLNGDRVVVSKTQYTFPLNVFFKPRYMDLVIFKYPHRTPYNGCLRIAGLPGDSVEIKNGSFSVLNNTSFSFPSLQLDQHLPAHYSPRDNVPLFRIPQKGDTIVFDTLDVTNTIFCYSLIRQENTDKEYVLQPLLHIDDSVYTNYSIDNFSLFKGNLNAIPDTLQTKWFFWDRFQEYVHKDLKRSGKDVGVTLTILENLVPITRYIFKQDAYFLLSENWQRGYDSRYFGPVNKAYMKGRAVAVLWSVAPDSKKVFSLRTRRIGKFIKNSLNR